jgi:hypothetical protein
MTTAHTGSSLGAPYIDNTQRYQVLSMDAHGHRPGREIHASGAAATVVAHEHKRLGRGIELAALSSTANAVSSPYFAGSP